MIRVGRLGFVNIRNKSGLPRPFIVTVGHQRNQDNGVWSQAAIAGIFNRSDYRLAHSQWETPLQSNAVSHWLGANRNKPCLYPIIQPCLCNSFEALEILDEMYGWWILRWIAVTSIIYIIAVTSIIYIYIWHGNNSTNNDRHGVVWLPYGRRVNVNEDWRLKSKYTKLHRRQHLGIIPSTCLQQSVIDVGLSALLVGIICPAWIMLNAWVFITHNPGIRLQQTATQPIIVSYDIPRCMTFALIIFFLFKHNSL